MNKNMTTLGKVWDQVEAMSANCFDQLVPVKDISFDSLDVIHVDGEAHKMRFMAQREIAYRFGIPILYLKKCPQDVQAYNLNHWIEKERNEELFFRFDGDEVRAIFTPRYQPVDNFEVLERLDSLGFGSESEVQCRLDREFMLLNIPDPENEFAVNTKDRMRPGISIGNSEVGIHCLSISAFILRLICTNGMIGTTDVTRSYKHISTKVLQEFPDVLASVVQELGTQKDRLQFSLESRVDDPETTLKAFNRQFQLGKPEQDAVEWVWPQEMGGTMFNVVNTYTKAAQYGDLSAENSYRLQKVGGRILAMVN